jgi:(2S)-methylsuccinyl-CoA dehydrogenase
MQAVSRRFPQGPPLTMTILDTAPLLNDAAQALGAARALLTAMTPAARQAAQRQNEEQAQCHGYAWAATMVCALEQSLAWAHRLQAQGQLAELECALLTIGQGEYLAQLGGGLAMSPGEIFRADQLAPARELDHFVQNPAVGRLRQAAANPALRARTAQLLANGAPTRSFGHLGEEDDTLIAMREQFARYADDHAEAAHGWHLRNELVPDAVMQEMAHLGVFGLTVEEAHGGLGQGKEALCVVTEELSRAHIALGSLGTRTEIAAELIQLSGTAEQKARLLRPIALGQIIPAASFTEPDVGSDLGAIKTRGQRVGEAWLIHGNKTWTTHGARSDLMTLMVRTGEPGSGYKGLSMFLAEKPRGTDAKPFPAPGMSGGEIHVLGYRGMKEYEIAFDGFAVAHHNLLGGEPGHGFKQLMRTFESARIQTAARAVGVAQNAMELGLAYALQRQQFGQALIGFPRVADKLVWMAAETMMARQLTRHAARTKDAGKRCDIEAGMAKLLAARVAFSNADMALQIHGGNGYAVEYRISRVWCDARILSVFEGAAEIQANIIARGLLA